MKKILDLLVSEVGDKTQDRLLDDIAKDATLADVWERYHLLGAVMRKEHHHYDQGFSERVRAQIGAEPNLLAPNNLADGHESNRFGGGLGTRPGNRLIPALAMAASIAAIAVIGLPFQTFFGGSAPSTIGTATSSGWQTEQPEFASRLNEFLVEHGEFSTASNMNGLIAYAKFVSYDSTR